MKLLILISTDRTIPKNIKLVDDGILKTWASRSYEGVQIFPYYAGCGEDKITEKTIEVTGKDIGLENIYDKTMKAFKLAYDNLDFDIMLRTNISTYIRPDYLRSMLKRTKAEKFLGSTWCHPLDQNCYFSGISLLFSRDIIRSLLQANIKNADGEVDDVFIGKIIADLYPDYNIFYKNFKRLDMMEDSIMRLKDPMFKISYSDIWAFRCKTMNGGIENRERDIEKMKLLDKIFYE